MYLVDFFQMKSLEDFLGREIIQWKPEGRLSKEKIRGWVFDWSWLTSRKKMSWEGKKKLDCTVISSKKWALRISRES